METSPSFSSASSLVVSSLSSSLSSPVVCWVSKSLSIASSASFAFFSSTDSSSGVSISPFSFCSSRSMRCCSVVSPRFRLEPCGSSPFPSESFPFDSNVGESAFVAESRSPNSSVATPTAATPAVPASPAATASATSETSFVAESTERGLKNETTASLTETRLSLNS